MIAGINLSLVIWSGLIIIDFIYLILCLVASYISASANLLIHYYDW